jgi:DNA-binding LacI/PurR family transcriptional regulator
MPTQAMQGVIGVVRPAKAAYDEVERGVLASIRQSSLSLLITYLHGGHERNFLRLESLVGQVDGLLVVDDVLPSRLLARLAERVPVVVIAGAVEEPVPPLTTVQQPARLVGERACTLLLERIARPGLPPRTDLLATELVPALLDLAGIRNGTKVKARYPQPSEARDTTLSSVSFALGDPQ